MTFGGKPYILEQVKLEQEIIADMALRDALAAKERAIAARKALKGPKTHRDKSRRRMQKLSRRKNRR